MYSFIFTLTREKLKFTLHLNLKYLFSVWRLKNRSASYRVLQTKYPLFLDTNKPPATMKIISAKYNYDIRAPEIVR